MLEFISKVDPDNIPEDIAIYKIQRRTIKGKNLRIQKRKPDNTFTYYSYKYTKSRIDWIAYKKKINFAIYHFTRV